MRELIEIIINHFLRPNMSAQKRYSRAFGFSWPKDDYLFEHVQIQPKYRSCVNDS